MRRTSTSGKDVFCAISANVLVVPTGNEVTGTVSQVYLLLKALTNIEANQCIQRGLIIVL